MSRRDDPPAGQAAAGLVDDDAGLAVVMDRCIRIEHARA